MRKGKTLPLAKLYLQDSGENCIQPKKKKQNRKTILWTAKYKIAWHMEDLSRSSAGRNSSFGWISQRNYQNKKWEIYLHDILYILYFLVDLKIWLSSFSGVESLKSYILNLIPPMATQQQGKLTSFVKKWTMGLTCWGPDDSPTQPVLMTEPHTSHAHSPALPLRPLPGPPPVPISRPSPCA